jgi:broad specificity phosphatase PhoE/predicted kinase
LFERACIPLETLVLGAADLARYSRARMKIAFVMVGLPARGKTFIARKVARYLSWLGHNTRVFNVGAYRRERLGSHQQHSFFDPLNVEATAARRDVALAALDDSLAWLDATGEIAIYDATNSTRDRRALVKQRFEASGVQVVFIESICDDPAIIEANIRATKARSPDYAGIPEEEAVRDFRMRIAHYEHTYEDVGEDEGSFVKIVDVGRLVVAHTIRGYLPARIVFFLVNTHTQARPVYLTRHGESEFNVLGRIGGDAPLSATGRTYARTLAEWARGEIDDDVVVWTSTLRRTTETADPLGRVYTTMRALDEIDAGVCDGMTYAEIAEAMPAEYAARAADKFRYRYPRGESYQDVIQRLEPVIFEIERERAPVLVIGHQAVLRALYAYMMDQPPDACPRIPVPLHTVIELTPTAYGCEERRIELPPTPLDPEGFGQK